LPGWGSRTKGTRRKQNSREGFKINEKRDHADGSHRGLPTVVNGLGEDPEVLREKNLKKPVEKEGLQRETSKGSNLGEYYAIIAKTDP